MRPFAKSPKAQLDPAAHLVNTDMNSPTISKNDIKYTKDAIHPKMPITTTPVFNLTQQQQCFNIFCFAK